MAAEDVGASVATERMGEAVSEAAEGMEEAISEGMEEAISAGMKEMVALRKIPWTSFVGVSNGKYFVKDFRISMKSAPGM